MKQFRDRFLIGLSLLFFVWIPFHRVIANPDRVLLYRDLARDFIPQKSILSRSLHSGNGIPFWNHFADGGAPYWANSVSSPLNPANLLFVLFSPNHVAEAFVYYLFFFYLTFTLGAYFLLRAMNFNRTTSCLFSSTLATSGVALSCHSLPHLLLSQAAVPWFFYFLILHRTKKNVVSGSLLGAAMAWPIYGGDPQFSYVMGIFFLGVLALRKLPRPIFSFTLVSASAFFFSAAQLLPTLDLTMESLRGTQSISENLFFSFHPFRLLESVYPLFLGNRFGAARFWGEEFVNYSYKSPFIFSTYPGILALLGILLSFDILNVRRNKLLLFASILGLLFSFGVFSILPIYEWSSLYLPFFELFRYPERLLFWPLFCFWLLSAYGYQWFESNRPSYLLGMSISLFLVGSFAFGIAIANEIIALPPGTSYGVFTTAIFGSILFMTNLFKGELRRKTLVVLSGIVLCLDSFLNQSMLLWDQSSGLLQKERYSSYLKIKKDVENRKLQIQSGAPFRMNSASLPMFQHGNTIMDHSTMTTFTSFNNILPNVGSIFEFEDISSYFSLDSRIKAEFANALRSKATGILDSRFINDLTGVYYLPNRDSDQQFYLEENKTAQPYIHFPKVVLSRTSKSESLNLLTPDKMNFTRDMTIFGLNNFDMAQTLDEPKIKVTSRNGREMKFTVSLREAKSDLVYLIINESYDKFWRGKANGQELPIYLANGWALGMAIPSSQFAGKEVSLELQYESPFIFWGKVLTGIWFSGLAFLLLTFLYRTRGWK